MNYGKLTAGTTKTAIDTAKPSEKGEIITYLSRMGDVLEQIFERHNIVIAVKGINTVIQCHEPNTNHWKQIIRKLTDLNIVPSETA